MSKIQAKKLHTYLGHNDSLYCLQARDDQHFFSAGSDGMVVMWDLASSDEGEVIAKVEGSIYAMVYDAGQDILYVGENNEGVHKIDLNGNKEIGSVQTGNHQIFDLKLNMESIWVALQSGEVLQLNQDLQTVNKIKASSERARSIDFFDEYMAVSYSDNVIRIFNADTLEQVNELKGHKNSVFVSKFHPSGKYLISGGRDAQLMVWDSSEEFVLRESIAAHLYTINHLTFSSDGKHFVTCSMDKSIKLWNAYNFKLLKVLDKHRHAGHGNSVNKVLWMKYRDLLVSCSDDRTISVWEIKSEE